MGSCAGEFLREGVMDCSAGTILYWFACTTDDSAVPVAGAMAFVRAELLAFLARIA